MLTFSKILYTIEILKGCLNMKRNIILTLILLATLFSCSKSNNENPEPEPPEQIRDTVFDNDAEAATAADAVYNGMVQLESFSSGSSKSLSLLCGLYADELINYSTSADQIEFYTVSLHPNNELIKKSIWNSAYALIDSANRILENLSYSPNVSSTLKQQLNGEARFIRAFCHFYLVNLFGNVPYIMSTDSATVYGSSRMQMNEVYQKIITDLSNARAVLTADYYASNYERTRPNKWAATAMLARAYLFTHDYANAEVEATNVINQAQLFELTVPANTFLKNSNETIWQLKPTAAGLNTYEGNEFILNATPNNVALNPELVNSFEANDARKNAWVGSFSANNTIFYYPAKYKVKSGSVITEYSMVLRLAEQYLIRAEARAQLNHLQEAKWDIDVIRSRASLSGTLAQSSIEVLDVIAKERKLELFTEWGHRLLDLKRTQKSDEVLMATKGNTWSPIDNLFPLPQEAVNKNPNLQQNAGY
jgi:starch-binding outer membrane protein, SusD/RagB family